MYVGCGGTDTAATGYFTGLELFHSFALMHDDIIDRGATRHGIATMHEFAVAGLEGSTEHVRHIAEGQATLMGDLLAHWAYEEIERRIPHAYKLSALKIFHEMNNAVIIGEMLDVKLAAQHTATKQEVMDKTALKTAYYTFVHPMRLGAATAGCGEEHDEFCKGYGLALGTAFQIQDDLMDILGNAKKLGKPTFSDLAEGQHTFFTQHIRDNGTAKQQKELAALFGKPVDDKARIAAQKLFEESGAIEAGKTAINEYCNKALGHLASAECSAEIRELWTVLVEKMRVRKE
jgi:geranylgeranyl diphosphate synthase type I